MAKIRSVVARILILGLAAAMHAQQTAPIPMGQTKRLDAIRQSPYPPPNTWQQHQMDTFANDFGQLQHFQAADLSLPASTKEQERIVFFGDSITAIWKLDRSFPDRGYINRGIGGQTTSQMLLRYRQYVLELNPLVAVILTGTNDIAGNTGAISNKDIEGNLQTMAS